MTSKDQHIIQLIRERIIQKDPTAEVILYGSRARGDARTDSDWDVLILLNRKKVDKKLEQSFRHHLLDVELEISQPISVYVYSKTEWEKKYLITPFYRSIKKEGIKIA